jgi:transposase
MHHPHSPALPTPGQDSLFILLPDSVKDAYAVLAGCSKMFDFFVRNYFICEISIAVSEGINNKIKRLKRMAYGYRDAKCFLLKIHQRCELLKPRLST